MARFASSAWLVALLFATAPVSGQDRDPDRAQARQAQGLLSDRCFRCHGPDEEARQASLRLDEPTALQDAAMRTEMRRRIRANDPEVRMPPPDAHLELSHDEIELLAAWLEQGAVYERHWSFQTPEARAVPEVRDRTWPREELDRFVLAELEAHQQRPAAAASAESWLRRVSFDLTGLPPSVERVRAWRAHDSRASRAELVDELLASPEAAEHMAARWLDLSRYGDTFGYQSDVEMEVWPWRDWVLRAFEQNLPYDQFLTWQVAGDLLPAPTPEQITATAWNRLHRQTNEGGSINEEFRVEYVADRVATLGTAFLGLTLECARCHDHKYDPISQRDYYSLFALFQNVDESGLYSHFTRATPTPTQWLYANDDAERVHRELRAEIAAAEAELRKREAAARDRAVAWMRAQEDAIDAIPAAMPTASFAFDAGEPGARRFEAPREIEGRHGRALEFDGESGVGFGAVGAFSRAQAFSIAFWMRAPTHSDERKIILHRTRAGPDAGHRGYELGIEAGHLELRFTHFWPGNALAVRTCEQVLANEWTHVAFAYDGSSHASGITLWIDGRVAALQVLRDHLTRDFVYRGEWGDSTGEVELTLAARFRDLGIVDGAIDDLAVFDRALTDIEVRHLLLTLDAPPATPEEHIAYYVARIDPEVDAARTALQALRVRENELSHQVRELMVMSEEATPKAAFLLQRGAYDQPGERVEPGFPTAIFAAHTKFAPNRLGLAQWLCDPRHPLMARVAVNRLWMQLFGRGLCATPENFGLQGAEPEHLALLDYLATEFVRSGFDQRALLRRIALSATYAQSSVVSPEQWNLDPTNARLARGPSRILSAEELRDAALSASALLVSKRGGPSVKPYQPEGLWEDAGTGKHYAQDHGEQLYRRSIYTFWRRTMAPPSLNCFDAPTREVSRARREPTQTPLQALVLLNDPQFVEAARVLAEALVGAKLGDTQERITQAFQRVLSRTPEPQEQRALERLLERARAHYAQHREQAEALRRIGERAPREDLDACEVAPWTSLVQALFNHGEFRVLR